MADSQGSSGRVATRTTVYKIGGSLLDLPGIGDRVRRLVDGNRNTRPLLIVGGGATADLVRHWDDVHGLDPERAHRLALRAMSLNEHLLAELLPDARLVADRFGAQTAWASGGIPILRACAFLGSEEPAGELPLPHTWEVTSDSIAAWVAVRWPAEGLVLAKSIDRPDRSSLEDVVAGGLVDPYFPRLAPELPSLGWVNLRADGDRRGIRRWMPRERRPTSPP